MARNVRAPGRLGKPPLTFVLIRSRGWLARRSCWKIGKCDVLRYSRPRRRDRPTTPRHRWAAAGSPLHHRARVRIGATSRTPVSRWLEWSETAARSVRSGRAQGPARPWKGSGGSCLRRSDDRGRRVLPGCAGGPRGDSPAPTEPPARGSRRGLAGARTWPGRSSAV
jgi:hypothetical protein